MLAIMQLDHVDEEEGGEWYIMDSAWVESFLNFAYIDKDVAPAPGPCKNHRLIEWDYSAGKYVGKFGLVMAVKERAGDYRRVNKAVWDQFCSFYPGSGPAITMQFSATDMNESGFYDVSKWVVLNPPPAPEDNAKKKKKKMGFGFGKKKEESMADSTTASKESKVSEDLAADDKKSSNISSLLGAIKNEPKMNYQKVPDPDSTGATAEDKESLLYESADDERNSKSDLVDGQDSAARRESVSVKHYTTSHE